ncbi:streptomycin 3-adenylyltransferase [Pseudomonas indica]|uniref:Aminoglycoside (3'') (9) adenylyltransferase n=1 Tax=Pseudomonas indica TaxID=137658 RepID=A0A1G9NQA0_9PSED|nr:streptomycin 3-adenylyltransferase [Pseudomonas indica]
MLRRHLGETLQAIHLFGSAVDGGLKPHSDIDVLVTVSAPLTAATRQALMTDLLSVSAWPVTEGSLRPLEVTVLVHDAVVPWRYPPLRELQFGEWLREDIEHGRIEPAAPDHDLAILLTKARQHSLCLMGPPATELFDPVPQADLARALYDTALQWNDEADWQGEERNILLALARIWLTLTTGEIAPKDTAAAWALQRLPEEHHPVLATARAAYLGEAEDDLGDRPSAMSAFVRYARGEIERGYLGILRGEN